MGTEQVGTYYYMDMARAMEALTGKPAMDIMRIVVEPQFGAYSAVTTTTRLFDPDNGRLLLDEDGELVLREYSFVQFTDEVQDVFEDLGIAASDTYSVDSHYTYTEHGKYKAVRPEVAA